MGLSYPELDLRMFVDPLGGSIEPLGRILVPERANLISTHGTLGYYHIRLESATREEIFQYAEFISVMFKPMFSEQFGVDEIDTAEEISDFLSKRDAVVLFVWDGDPMNASSRPVGFLTGMPGVLYGIEPEYITDDDGYTLPPPREDTFYLDTIGVLSAYRRRKVGFNLWNMFRKQIFTQDTPWKSFCTFIINDSFARLLKKDQWLRWEDRGQAGMVCEGIISNNRHVARTYVFVDVTEPVLAADATL